MTIKRQTTEIDEETMRRLHSDVRGVLDLKPEAVRKRNRERDPHSDYIDSWGSGQTEISEDDWFPSVHPLPGARTTADLATPWLLFPFERAYAMQGMETFLLNMARDPDFAIHLR